MEPALWLPPGKSRGADTDRVGEYLSKVMRSNRFPWSRVEPGLVSTARSVRQAFDRRFAPLDLNLSQATLIAFLAEFGPHTQTQIADRLRLGRAATGTCIDHLESRQLIHRDPDPADRRVWQVSVTDAGRAMSEEVRRLDAELSTQLRSGITKEERQQLARILERLQQNLDQILEDPPATHSTAVQSKSN